MHRGRGELPGRPAPGHLDQNTAAERAELSKQQVVSMRLMVARMVPIHSNEIPT